jgi:hypothetical protein
MCRSIKPLFNLDPPVTDIEIRAAALQFVRKISGSHKPSRANQPAFDQAVEDVTAAAERLLARWATAVPPKSREALAAQARERAAGRAPRFPA